MKQKLFSIFSSSINFLIPVFVVFYVWYLFFWGALNYLNFKFPIKPSRDFLPRGTLSPEPFEISIFIFSSVIVAILVFAYFNFRKKIKTSLFSNINLLYRSIALVLMVIIFYFLLGAYPLKDENLKLFEKTTLIYLLGILIAIFIIELLDRISKKAKVIKSIVFIVIFLVIGIITFEPRFPVSYYDYSFFLGPMFELGQGKTIFTDITPQYGFLGMLFIVFLSKVYILDPFSLPLYIWVLSVIQFSIIFFILYKITRSVSFSLIGIFSTITVSYFSLSHLPFSYPQSGPTRWLPFILAIFSFLIFRRFNSRIFIFLLAIFCFLIIDSGIALFLAFVLSVIFLFFKKKLSLREAISSILFFVLCLFLIFIGINMISLIFGYKIINPNSLFQLFSTYGSSGMDMIRVEPLTFFWLVPFTYFASLFFFLKNKSDYSNLLLFSANCLLFGSVYYMGRSHPHNLFHISTLFLLNLFIFFSILFIKIKSKKSALFFLAILFIFLITIPIFNRQKELYFIIHSNIAGFKGEYFSSGINSVKTIFEKDQLLIESNLKDKKVLILSPYDAYLFYLTKKENLLKENPQNKIVLKSVIKSSLIEAIAICPKKIAVDCRVSKMCPDVSIDFEGYSTQAELLKELEKQCKQKYYPVKCTQWTCIMQSK